MEFLAPDMTSFGRYILSRLREEEMVEVADLWLIKAVEEFGFSEDASYEEILAGAAKEHLIRFPLNQIWHLRTRYVHVFKDEYIIIAPDTVPGWVEGQLLLPTLWMAPVDPRSVPTWPSHRATLGGHSFHKYFRFSRKAKV